jgi:hypothetical protein
MAPPSKTAGDGRRKSGGKPNMVVTLKVSTDELRKLLDPSALDPSAVKEESPLKDTKASPVESPAAAPASTNGNADNASDSNAATPAGDGTPGPSTMGPPTENPKKKGVKRAAPNNDGIPKPRGKPGPKKKPRLYVILVLLHGNLTLTCFSEDGTIDQSAKTTTVHKLGPKANQGAINAGLRALDRSGKPCRKWSRGGFTLKSFTGVVWEIPRWTAPPRSGPDGESTEASAAASADNSSGKENKENGVEPNSVNNSNSGDQEAQSAPSVHASSPAPMAVGAAA